MSNLMMYLNTNILRKNGIRRCLLNARLLLVCRASNFVGIEHKLADPRQKHFKRLIKTLQQKQKCLEFRESEVGSSNILQLGGKQSDLHVCQPVIVDQTFDTLSYDCKDPLLSSVKPGCLSCNEQTLSTSDNRKTSEFCNTLTTTGSSVAEYCSKTDVIHGTRSLSAVSSSVKESAVSNTSKGKSRAKNWKMKKPFIEHQEDKRTSFSRATFVTLQERLSTDEVLILTQLARALSLPEDVRHSLHAYLDRQKAFSVGECETSTGEVTKVDSTASSLAESLPAVKRKRKKESKKSSVSRKEDTTTCSEPVWVTEDIQDPSVDEVVKFDSAASSLAETLPAVKTKQKKESKKRSVSKKKAATKCSEPMWNIEDIQDPERLKALLERTAKLLSSKKHLLLERAVERERLTKENTYHDRMASFVELCINTGMLPYAQSVLTTTYFGGRRKTKTVQHGLRAIRDINIYNQLMHAWCKQSNLEAVRILYMQIGDLGLKPNFLTFAVLLLCHGRQELLAADAVKQVLGDVKQTGLRLEAIFNECQLVEEEENIILKTIKAVQPKFMPDSKPGRIDYSSPLLSALNNSSEKITNPYVGVMSDADFTRQIAQQLEIEASDKITVQSVVPEPKLTPVITAARERLAEQKQKWRDALKRAFMTSRRHLAVHTHTKQSTSILPYLKLWPVDTYVDLMMQEIETIGRHMDVYSPECVVLHSLLGKKVFRKYSVQVRVKTDYINKVLNLYKAYTDVSTKDHLDSVHRQLWTDTTDNMKLNHVMLCNSERWPYAVTKAIGKFLYSIIMSDVKVGNISTRKSAEKEIIEAADSTFVRSETSEIPAFFTVFRYRNKMLCEEIVPHPFLVRLYDEAELRELSFEPHTLPSLVPPIPWFSHNCGGNMLSTTEFIRHPGQVSQQLDVIRSLPPQSLIPMFDGLNVVSNCAWTVNKPILDLLIEVFNKGGDSKLDVAITYDRMAHLKRLSVTMSDQEKYRIIKQNKRILKEQKEAYSLWCSELYRLSIANKYRDEVIWFPHNMDFRGRIYPTSTLFNHFGNDVARSMLVFAKGKPLGAGGLDWLKIHLVNLTGFKKRQPNRERLEFANAMLHEILDSTDKPFDGRRWWQTSDEPWQTLACCMEIAGAVRSPNPEQFVSRIPVHQDGSCNVLQHYAALGRDVVGAESVNLTPVDAPKDVYSDVLALVEKKRQEDAANGVKIAKSLEGFVERKVIKQTIMTSVYGVTRYGARAQIENQLRHNIDNFPPELVFDARSYLAEKTFECLYVMFTTNKAIQDWLVTCADVIARVRQQPVEWVTPLGWPVIQPYFRTNKLVDKKKGETVTFEKSNPAKQKGAFPPNFIHSLDAVHMMLTAVHCFRAGITFASIHDCFWTHACDVPVMNTVCREQFVSLHSQPVLANLSKSLLDRYGYTASDIASEEVRQKREAKELVNYLLQCIPKQGAFDIQKVLESTYFFS